MLSVRAAVLALLVLSPLAVSRAGAPAPDAAPAARPEAPLAPLAAPILTGLVSDAQSRQALPSAQVSIAGTSRGALTGKDGRYRIALPDTLAGRTVRVRVMLAGYALVERKVRLMGDSTTADFQLAAQSVALQEIVVKAAGNAPARKDIASSVSQLAVASAPAAPPLHLPRDFNTEGYATIDENPFLAVEANPLSTFSIDVDRASYGNVRRFLHEGKLPPRDAVRIEELINYFPYNDAPPTGAEPFSVTTEVGAAPWQRSHRLVRIGLQARRIDASRMPPNNLVFLLDVSGSMSMPNKLDLVKPAMQLLVDQLRPQDRVAIVVYAGAAGLVLPPTPGSEKEKIRQAIEALEAGGSTAGGAGLRLAYDVAKQNHMVEGNNRVILATDGDFNIGASSDAEMTQLIEERRAQGTFLSVLGFGEGNIKDSKMEALADHGNGNYAYIDNLLEARKVLVSEAGGTLVTIAKDVKIQVEFNPARVAGYRLIGYENRLLRNEDFADDTKDAGDLGSGHAVTALYEVVPRGVSDVELRGVDTLRYQTRPRATGGSDELLFVKLRYKDPDGGASKLLSQAVRDDGRATGTDFSFAAAVAAWGMILRDSPNRGRATLDLVRELGRAGLGADPGGYRAEFMHLVEATRALKPDAPLKAAPGR